MNELLQAIAVSLAAGKNVKERSTKTYREEETIRRSNQTAQERHDEAMREFYRNTYNS